MRADKLMAEIEKEFGSELHPGEFNIVANNAPDYDLESLGIREAFKAHTWLTLPATLMQYEQGAYNFLSKQGLRYYLPAYLKFCIQDYVGADSIPDGLILNLTLPLEIDVLLSALDVKLYGMDINMPKINWHVFHQKQLGEADQRVHYFMERYSQFSFGQSQSLLHFLEYMRDEHGKDYWNNEPQIAIDRYWFQFA